MELLRTMLLLMGCCFLYGPTVAEKLSPKVLAFLRYITGDVDNQYQVGLKGNEYDLVQVRARRVHVSSLEPKLTLFIEQATNGELKFFHLGIVKEGPNNTISMKLHTFTDFSNITFGTYDLSKLSKVKPEHLQSDDQCVASFEVWGDSLMTGVYPNCRYTVNGKHPSLIITYTNDFDTVFFPVNTDQKHAIAPYVFNHRPVMEPLADAPKGYSKPTHY